jgi:beta-lactamase regulating signal transducer with metallopeptidase domain
MFKIWVIVLASTLPPLMMTPTFPLAGTAPLNKAATPSAPDGSTTSLV